MHAIENLIIKGRLDQALEKMLDFADNHYRNSIILQMGRYNSLKNDIELGVVDDRFANTQKNQIRGAIQSIFNDMREEGLIPDNPVDPPEVEENAPQNAPAIQAVFISYNHNDSDVADRIVAKLESKGIPTLLDRQDAKAGQNIKEFITESIRNSKATLFIVSNKSLLSSWVGLESVLTIIQSDFTDRQFFPCYLDDDFLVDEDFTVKAFDALQLEVDKVRQRIEERNQRNMAISSLNSKLERLKDLQNNLDRIMNYLHNVVCVDIRDARFDAGIEKVIESIKTV
jgi:hypothetical protein